MDLAVNLVNQSWISFQHTEEDLKVVREYRRGELQCGDILLYKKYVNEGIISCISLLNHTILFGVGWYRLVPIGVEGHGSLKLSFGANIRMNESDSFSLQAIISCLSESNQDDESTYLIEKLKRREATIPVNFDNSKPLAKNKGIRSRNIGFSPKSDFTITRESTSEELNKIEKLLLKKKVAVVLPNRNTNVTTQPELSGSSVEFQNTTSTQLTNLAVDKSDVIPSISDKSKHIDNNMSISSGISNIILKPKFGLGKENEELELKPMEASTLNVNIVKLSTEVVTNNPNKRKASASEVEVQLNEADQPSTNKSISAETISGGKVSSTKANDIVNGNGSSITSSNSSIDDEIRDKISENVGTQLTDVPEAARINAKKFKESVSAEAASDAHKSIPISPLQDNVPVLPNISNNIYTTNTDKIAAVRNDSFEHSLIATKSKKKNSTESKVLGNPSIKTTEVTNPSKFNDTYLNGDQSLKSTETQIFNSIFLTKNKKTTTPNTSNHPTTPTKATEVTPRSSGLKINLNPNKAKEVETVEQEESEICVSVEAAASALESSTTKVLNKKQRSDLPEEAQNPSPTTLTKGKDIASSNTSSPNTTLMKDNVTTVIISSSKLQLAATKPKESNFKESTPSEKPSSEEVSKVVVPSISNSKKLSIYQASKSSDSYTKNVTDKASQTLPLKSSNTSELSRELPRGFRKTVQLLPEVTKAIEKTDFIESDSESSEKIAQLLNLSKVVELPKSNNKKLNESQTVQCQKPNSTPILKAIESIIPNPSNPNTMLTKGRESIAANNSFESSFEITEDSKSNTIKPKPVEKFPLRADEVAGPTKLVEKNLSDDRPSKPVVKPVKTNSTPKPDASTTVTPNQKSVNSREFIATNNLKSNLEVNKAKEGDSSKLKSGEKLVPKTAVVIAPTNKLLEKNLNECQSSKPVTELVRAKSTSVQEDNAATPSNTTCLNQTFSNSKESLHKNHKPQSNYDLTGTAKTHQLVKNQRDLKDLKNLANIHKSVTLSLDSKSTTRSSSPSTLTTLSIGITSINSKLDSSLAKSKKTPTLSNSVKVTSDTIQVKEDKIDAVKQPSRYNSTQAAAPRAELETSQILKEKRLPKLLSLAQKIDTFHPTTRDTITGSSSSSSLGSRSNSNEPMIVSRGSGTSIQLNPRETDVDSISSSLHNVLCDYKYDEVKIRGRKSEINSRLSTRRRSLDLAAAPSNSNHRYTTNIDLKTVLQNEGHSVNFEVQKIAVTQSKDKINQPTKTLIQTPKCDVATVFSTSSESDTLTQSPGTPKRPPTEPLRNNTVTVPNISSYRDTPAKSTSIPSKPSTETSKNISATAPSIQNYRDSKIFSAHKSPTVSSNSSKEIRKEVPEILVPKLTSIAMAPRRKSVDSKDYPTPILSIETSKAYSASYSNIPRHKDVPVKSSDVTSKPPTEIPKVSASVPFKSSIETPKNKAVTAPSISDYKDEQINVINAISDHQAHITNPNSSLTHKSIEIHKKQSQPPKPSKFSKPTQSKDLKLDQNGVSKQVSNLSKGKEMSIPYTPYRKDKSPAVKSPSSNTSFKADRPKPTASSSTQFSDATVKANRPTSLPSDFLKLHLLQQARTRPTLTSSSSKYKESAVPTNISAIANRTSDNLQSDPQGKALPICSSAIDPSTDFSLSKGKRIENNKNSIHQPQSKKPKTQLQPDMPDSDPYSDVGCNSGFNSGSNESSSGSGENVLKSNNKSCKQKKRRNATKAYREVVDDNLLTKLLLKSKSLQLAKPEPVSTTVTITPTGKSKTNISISPTTSTVNSTFSVPSTVSKPTTANISSTVSAVNNTISAPNNFSKSSANLVDLTLDDSD